MPLPWRHFSPASMTDHFELSIMTGTRAMSGSEATRFRKVVIAFSESSIASSMFTSMICAPFSTCCLAIGQGGFVVAGEDQLGEFGRAGDVRALADVDEIGFRANGQRLQPAQAGAGLDLGAARAAADRGRLRPKRGCARAWCRSSRRRC